MEFQYTAKDETGRVVKGVLEAETEDALAELLDGQSLFLLKANPYQKQEKVRSFQRIRQKDIMYFTLDLSTVLSAGIPLSVGLRDLRDAQEHTKLRVIIDDVLASIEGGASLSAAFARHPQYFDSLYVSIVNAGETSGNVDRVLADIAAFLEWKADLRRDVTQASVYPLMVLGAVSGLVILLSTVVFPQFATVLKQARGPLPLPTQILFGLSDLFRSFWWVLLAGFVVSLTSLWLYVRTAKGRFWFDGFKLRVPIFGPLIRKIALSRFCHFFQILFGAGVDISTSLGILENIIGNVVLAKAIRMIRDEVRAGQSLAVSVAATGEFPTMVIRMFQIGESSGQLVGALEKACRFYDKEIPATIKRVFSIVEPLLYVFLAVVVLTVALAIYLPLYQMIGSLSKR
jgi:type II secretory pathway component PulF